MLNNPLCRRKRFFLGLFFILVPIFLNDFTFFQNDLKNILQNNGEYKVYGRLAKSAQDGIFSNSMFLGFCQNETLDTAPLEFSTGLNNNDIQLDFYRQSVCPYYLPYFSQPGYAAILYYGLGKFYPSPIVFRIFAAALLAIAIALILTWLSVESSYLTAIFALITILFSRWFVDFGDNISLLMGSMYLPLAAGLWGFQKENKSLVFFGISGCLLVSLLLSGAEYIFSTIAMCFLPILYYAVVFHWNHSIIISKVKVIGLAVVAPILIATIAIFLQLISEKGVAETFDYFIYTVGKRTLVGSPELGDYYQRVKEIPVLDVLWNYLNLPALVIFKIKIHFYHMFLALILVRQYVKFDIDFKSCQKTKALLRITFFSSLAPFAWLIFSSPHAAAHTFIDPVVWYMPFSLFVGFMLSHLLAFKLNRMIERR